MPGASKLLDRQAQEQVVEAIREAERASSAEIRVHIENHCRGDVLDRATEVFSELKMDRTELRNGVLIYVAVKDRKTAIIGDSGINRYVRREFWDTCYRAMSGHFATGDFAGGLCAAIGLLPRELGECFPHQSDDVNELPDEISFG